MATSRTTAAKKAPAKKAAPRKAAAKPAAVDAVDAQLESIQATDDPELLREEAAKLRKLAAELGGDADLTAMAEEKEAAAKAIDGLDATTDIDADDDEDDFSDIPEEFRFTTRKKEGDEREPEVIPIVIDGRRWELTQPSESALFILAAKITSETATNQDRTLSMIDLVRLCIGPVAWSHLYQLMMDPRSDFDDDGVGEIAMRIVERWGSATPKNRAEKRRAARARK
jgi:hypothetical protein